MATMPAPLPTRCVSCFANRDLSEEGRGKKNSLILLSGSVIKREM